MMLVSSLPLSLVRINVGTPFWPSVRFRLMRFYSLMYFISFDPLEFHLVSPIRFLPRRALKSPQIIVLDVSGMDFRMFYASMSGKELVSGRYK